MPASPRAPEAASTIDVAPGVTIGLLGVLVATALLPTIFERVFALGPLRPNERVGAWLFAASLMFTSAAVAAFHSRLPRVVPAMLFGCLVLLAAELGVRAFVIATQPPAVLERLGWLAARTYPHNALIRPHPFLQYTGHYETNTLGYKNATDFVVQKPVNTIRVVCLGGSTTADQNWPQHMQEWLDGKAQRSGKRFEVLNFGRNGYSSVHVAINFILVASNFDPDYVVVHTGWNDTVLRGLGTKLRSDFSNVFEVLQPPDIPERWALRASVIVRGAFDRLGGEPGWAELRPALPPDRSGDPTFDDPGELVVPRRNLEKILDFAAARNITPILTTIPHSTAPDVPDAHEAKHLDQYAALVRTIRHERQDSTLFVDLDKQMTGADNRLFEDLAHMYVEGQRLKGLAVGKVLWSDVLSKGFASRRVISKR